jgi:hypothetical protein
MDTKFKEYIISHIHVINDIVKMTYPNITEIKLDDNIDDKTEITFSYGAYFISKQYDTIDPSDNELYDIITLITQEYRKSKINNILD